MYHEINENSARLAHNANSFRDFIDGKATEEYRHYVNEAREIAAKKKESLPVEMHEKIDYLLGRYEKKLAEWKNEYYRIEAMCPSVMISGSSNFPVRKKEKQNSRRESHQREYEKIEYILQQLKNMSIDNAVRSDDENAVAKIREKIAKLKEHDELAKKLAAWYRKHKTFTGCPDLKPENVEKFNSQAKEYGFRPFYNSPEIRRLEGRIKELERIKGSKQKGWDFNGGSVKFNKTEQRIEINFDSKPSTQIIQMLKQNAFKWAPSKSVWQRLLTSNAIRATEMLKDRLNA